MGSREKQSSDKMRSLLVLTVASLASAAPQFYGLPLTYSSPLTYTYTPQVTKLVAKNIEVPVEVAKFSVKETGCVNSFGLNVPCAQEGEARRKRSADEEEAEAPRRPRPHLLPQARREEHRAGASVQQRRRLARPLCLI